MCLYVEKGEGIRVAERNVECWKVLMRRDDGRLYSPYMFELYTLGETKRIGRELEIKYNTPPWSDVVHFGFHTYVEKDEAKELAMCSPDAVLVRCVIPAGSSYVKGETVSSRKSYVSDVLEVGKGFESCV